MRVLTKSRFKLGLECPNKLFYTGKEEYANTKKENTFLESLAHGGFQVQELARLHYPEGILIKESGADYKKLYEQTKKLLLKKNVTIFEAAFLKDNLFVRVDILVKKGNSIELIEVKSKSFDSNDKNLIIGKRGGLLKPWKPVIFDIAFQKHVMSLCYPNWKIDSYLMMADKNTKASVDGLNQMFQITKNSDNQTIVENKAKTLNDIGNTILGRKNVTKILDKIEKNEIKCNEKLPFDKYIDFLKKKYVKDKFANSKTEYSACKECEFKTKSENKKLKSGFVKCFQTLNNWTNNDFNKENTFDIYDFRQGAKLFEEKIYFKDQLDKEKIGFKQGKNKLSRTERQLHQIQKALKKDGTIFVDKKNLKKEIETWKYPLHFIDFETSTVAIPFSKGIGPYEQIAFQYSHHIYNENGKIKHASQYLNTKSGVFPNFDFIRDLKKALGKDNGTIFRYADHENTVLNDIYNQLSNSKEKDRKLLMNFIQDISHSKDKSKTKWAGKRDMVDLLEVVKNYYYNPLAKGSNSIKDILPASLNSSKFLKEKYVKPIKELNLTTKNFSENHIWLEIKNNKVVNPYERLPQVFEGWSDEQLDKTLSKIVNISDGGSALTAYSKLQFTEISDLERDKLKSAMQKYCELDTLAMVMIFEHFKELI